VKKIKKISEKYPGISENKRLLLIIAIFVVFVIFIFLFIFAASFMKGFIMSILFLCFLIVSYVIIRIPKVFPYDYPVIIFTLSVDGVEDEFEYRMKDSSVIVGRGDKCDLKLSGYDWISKQQFTIARQREGKRKFVYKLRNLAKVEVSPTRYMNVDNNTIVDIDYREILLKDDPDKNCFIVGNIESGVYAKFMIKLPDSTRS